MYERFHKLPLWGQFVVVLILLIIAWTLLQLMMGVIKALFPIAILAAIIVVLLQLYDRFHD